MAVHRLQNVSDHVKNYHPQVLVLSGDPKTRPPLVDFGYLLTKNNSLMFVANIIPVCRWGLYLGIVLEIL